MQHLRGRASVVASAMVWWALLSLCLGAQAQGLTLETRHLYCNNSVPDAWLARVDQALAAQAR